MISKFLNFKVVEAKKAALLNGAVNFLVILPKTGGARAPITYLAISVVYRRLYGELEKEISYCFDGISSFLGLRTFVLPSLNFRGLVVIINFNIRLSGNDLRGR